MSANKSDTDKPPIGLIPSSAIIAEANVMAFGEKKYARHNWRKGMKWSRLLDASMRHILAFNEGEDLDPETGLNHLAHARCCLAFLIEYASTHPQFDDRHKYGQQTGVNIHSFDSQTSSTEVTASSGEDEQPV